MSLAELRTLPLARDTDAAVDENGVAYDLRPSSYSGKLITQVKVYVAGLSHVGFGAAASPPAPTAANTVYQEAATEEVYTLDSRRQNHDYLYVYADSTSVAHVVRISLFY